MFISLQKSQVKRAISRETITRLQVNIRPVKKYNPNHGYHGQFSSGSAVAVSPGRFGSGSVIFEFAPNPDNLVASERWNALSHQEKADRSQKLADEYIPKILDAQGIKGGEVISQIGSYENDTNKSFTLVMPEGSDPTSIVGTTKALGYNLSQKSMMTVADSPFPGSEPTDAIHIESSKEFSLLSAKSMYDDLRTIKVGDQNAIEGQTTNGKTMSILNIGKAMDTDSLMGAIRERLPEGYQIHKSIAYYWMPTEEKDYGENSNYRSYGRQGGQQGGRLGEPVQQASGDYRREIAALVTKFFQWIGKYSPDQLRDFHGRFSSGGFGEKVAPLPLDQRKRIGPQKAEPQDIKNRLSLTEVGGKEVLS